MSRAVQILSASCPTTGDTGGQWVFPKLGNLAKNAGSHVFTRGPALFHENARRGKLRHHRENLDDPAAAKGIPPQNWGQFRWTTAPLAASSGNTAATSDWPCGRIVGQRQLLLSKPAAGLSACA